MIEFGCQIEFSAVKVDGQGRLGFVDGKRLDTSPYFDVLPDRDPEHWETEGKAALSHFLVRPFPGHEWNHLLLYLMQQRPIELAQMLARGLAGAGGDEAAGTLYPAKPEAVDASVGRLDDWAPLYAEVAGRQWTDALRSAADDLIGPASYVITRSDGPSATGLSGRRPGAMGRLLDETYLHMAFTAEALALTLDVWLLETLGEKLDGYLSELAFRNPLFIRLTRMGREKGMRFLETWHRQSFRYPPFTASFVRTLDNLHLSRRPFGQADGD